MHPSASLPPGPSGGRLGPPPAIAAAQRAVRRLLVHDRPEEAQEYLEKLFQATLPVPVPARPEDFIGKLIDQWKLAEGEDRDDLALELARLVEPNPRKLKNFVASLAIGWDICRSAAPACRFDDHLLITYLRLYHPEVFRVLAYDPGLITELQRALTEDPSQLSPGAPAIRRFFHRAFRHTFTRIPDPEDLPASDRVVDELLARLDRHRGDSAFVELFKETFGSEKDLVERLRPLLTIQSAGAVVAGPDPGSPDPEPEPPPEEAGA